MKRIYLVIGIICFTFSFAIAQVSKKIIKSGENLIIEDEKVFFTELKMEDNSSITIPPNLKFKNWELTVLKADIGKNCSIIANGLNGIRNVPGVKPKGKAKDCDNGEPGNEGNPGNDGTNACNIKITMGIINIKELTIEAKGGNGNFGSDGGDGGQAGDADCDGCGLKKFSPNNGGNGGTGGQGGKGGNGGNVVIEIWDASNPNIIMSDTLSANINSSIKVINTYGSGEAGMEGGEGGEGSPSKDNCLIHKIGHGDKGKKGKNGAKGKDGNSGKYELKVISSPKN